MYFIKRYCCSKEPFHLKSQEHSSNLDETIMNIFPTLEEEGGKKKSEMKNPLSWWGSLKRRVSVL